MVECVDTNPSSAPRGFTPPGGQLENTKMSPGQSPRSRFLQAVADNPVGSAQVVSTGLSGVCPDCQTYYCGLTPREFYTGVMEGDYFDEGAFSWGACDSCGTGLGGNRFIAHYLNQNEEWVHISICVDCLSFCDHGKTPEEWED